LLRAGGSMRRHYMAAVCRMQPTIILRAAKNKSFTCRQNTRPASIAPHSLAPWSGWRKVSRRLFYCGGGGLLWGRPKKRPSPA